MAKITIERHGSAILVNAEEDTAAELDTIDLLYRGCWGTEPMLKWNPPPYTLFFESRTVAEQFCIELARRLRRAMFVGSEILMQ